MKLTVFRHAAYDSPWWAFPSSRSGRYHRAGSHTVQYWCLHPLGPAAEMLRHNVGPAGDPDEVILNLWAAVLDVEDKDLLQIDFGDCAENRITPDELVADDYSSTQALADDIRARGVAAMISPSAALPGSHNLIVFGARVQHPYLLTPFTPEEIPTGHLSDAARSPAEVAPHVRWFGTPHKALEQWKTTGGYDVFDDPIATRW
ncbi:RES family NAD+ phosphorylase [Mycobacterium spongiae]|uniref:RES domain-containing protein n=1 Tax=Mycobacterium spongiae TaxID=886343 RepID=A0A975JZS1_9MYCO|nr:RES family NAD+ phosphorylase [Mycobacterium spongiae]QUR68721.1 RES domain-containing protein [Mycobacterium spongiae]